MNKLKIFLSALFLLLSIMSGPASADTLWDYSPDATGGTLVDGNWLNKSSWQNFVEMVTFSNDVTLTSMDIFSSSLYGTIGMDVLVKIFSDSSSLPGTLLYSFTEGIDILDTDGTGTISDLTRKYVDFTDDILLGAGTYWIGMSGINTNLGQAGLSGVAGGDSAMAQLDGTSFSFIADITGDMAFRVYGNADNGTQPIPETTTMILLGSGLCALAVCGRKKFKR